MLMKFAKLFRYLQSYEVETREQRVGLCSSAGTHLALAGDLDPGDHLAQFYLGLLFVVLSAAASKLLIKTHQVYTSPPSEGSQRLTQRPRELSFFSQTTFQGDLTCSSLLERYFVSSLHLAILVLSARNEYDEALRLCGQALSEYPDNLVLLALRFSFKISMTSFITNHHHFVVFQGKVGGKDCWWRGSTGHCQANVSGQQDNIKLKIL